MSRCTVLGKVYGKPRPKFTTVGGHPQAYTPRKAKEYERLIAATYKAQGGEKHEGSILVTITAQRSLPKSTPKKVTSEPDNSKPDADNIAKIVLDALNGVAYDDDRQVVRLLVRKMPRARLEVERLDIVVKEVLS